VNPVTFASAPGMFQRCEIIYDPYLQKYLRHEDYCSDCDDLDASCVVRIKVWIGTGWLRGDVNEELECQRRLMVPGRLDSVIRSPRRDLEDDCMFMMSTVPWMTRCEMLLIAKLTFSHTTLCPGFRHALNLQCGSRLPGIHAGGLLLI
jgi:hypothetical protein